MSEGGAAVLELDRTGPVGRSGSAEGGPETPRDKILAMPNEYGKKPQLALSPLREVKVGFRDYTASTRETLDYLAVTRGVEVSSPLITKLQGYLDTWKEGTDVPSTRLVVLQRGRRPAAFASPDGTIFINQALINTLDTVDELGGVLKHEFDHIKNKTFERKINAGEGDKITAFGVCWSHETASDLGTPEGLEQVGLRSTGLASAIEKISANSRGNVHQSGEMRGATVMGEHALRHFATSDVPETPIPANWKTASVGETNAEIVRWELKDDDVDHSVAVQAVAKLNLQDFDWFYATADTPHKVNVVNEVITERLTNARFTPEDIKHFLIDIDLGVHAKYTGVSPIITSPEELAKLAEGLAELEYSTKFDQMSMIIFDRARSKKKSPTVRFMNYWENNFFIEGIDATKKGVPVTQETFLKTIKSVNEVPLTDGEDKEELRKAVTSVIVNYIQAQYINPTKYKQEEVNITDIAEFLDKVEQLGITIDRTIFRDTVKRRIYPAQVAENVSSLRPVEERDLDARIDSFFNLLGVVYSSGELTTGKQVDKFTADVVKFFTDHRMDDQQREPYVEKIIDRLNTYEERSAAGGTSERTEHEKLIIRKALQIKTASVLYSKEGDQVYGALGKIMGADDINPRDLQWEELLQMCSPLLFNRSIFFSRTIGFNNYPRLMELPYIAELVRQKETVSAPTSIKALGEYTEARHQYLKSKDIDVRPDIFNDELQSLIVSRDIRNAFLQILHDGVSQEENGDLYTFIDRWIPATSQTRRVKAEILRETLASDIPFDRKIQFLYINFDKLGPEGLTMLANQITTMDEYRLLHQRMGDKIQEYLSSNINVTVAAGLDLLSSEFTEHFDALLKTTASDPESKRKDSTEAAYNWYKALSRLVYGNMTFDSSSKKFNVNSYYANQLRSFQDIVDTLHDLPQSQRASLIMKSLLDVNGALTTPENRTRLGELTVDALHIEDPFIRSILTSAVDVADAKVVGYPLGTLFAPLLFNSLDSSNIDIDELLRLEEEANMRFKVPLKSFTADEIRKLMTSPAKEIITMGQYNTSYPDSYPARLAKENSQAYFDVGNVLDRLFPEQIVTESQTASEVDPGIEAIIQGVQASGPVGVRSLQIARQIRDFSPEVSERLSQTFDSNPGLNKLLFWYNLYNFQEKKDSGDERYREAGNFVADRLVSVGDKLGGGSLYTTYAADVRDESGEVKEAVVKMLNPNAALVISSFYKLALDTLEKVKETGDPDAVRQAQQSLMLVELAQQWCLADINDPSFVQDDNTFRGMISNFNQQASDVSVEVPERIYTSYLIKSEEEAQGRTLNKVLQDETVPLAVKQAAVKTVLDLFSYELNHPVGGSRKGNEFLIRSDPNPGNFMVNDDEGQVTISVLDRNLFLHLTEGEAGAIRDLWEGRPEAFFTGFVKSVFAENKVSKLRQPVIGLQLKRMVEAEIATAGGLDQVDPLNLMQRVTKHLEDRGLHIPLRLHLGIKNVFALQELRKRTFPEGNNLN